MNYISNKNSPESLAMHYNNYGKQLQYLLENNSIDKPIVLIGTAGSGKSTVGRRVAKKVRLQFYDSDKIIEERENMSVISIYNTYGAEYFQKREKEVIEEVISGYGRVVLSTGSNAFIDPEIRHFIKSHSVTVWLYADIKILHERISRRNSRPGFTPENTLQVLEKIISEHYPIYSEADIAIESHEYDIYRVVDIVILKLKEYFETTLLADDKI